MNLPALSTVAFTVWHFPINHVVRALLSALAAGCAATVRLPATGLLFSTFPA
jgi:acyl-CoA reductase-like NAD-dependent aldehyde dehydrogenase